jgi:hypothetical protein
MPEIAEQIKDHQRKQDRDHCGVIPLRVVDCYDSLHAGTDNTDIEQFLQDG